MVNIYNTTVVEYALFLLPKIEKNGLHPHLFRYIQIFFVLF